MPTVLLVNYESLQNVFCMKVIDYCSVLLALKMGWLRGTAVEYRSLAGELSLSCARPVAVRWPLM